MAIKKDLLIIISKTSGSQDDPLPEFKKILDKAQISYAIKRIKTPPEVYDFLKQEAEKFKDIAVYGGDGSVVSAMKALLNSPNRLLALPGGTANTIANELSLPGTAIENLKIYVEKRYVTDYFDIASINNEPLVLDMHSGWWTEAIAATPRDLKKRFGALAYAISALKKLSSTKKHHYELLLDNKKIRTSGYTLLVANRGYQGFLGVNLFPRKHRTGILQIAIIKSLSPLRILLWFLGRYINKNLGGAIKTYRTHNPIIKRTPENFLINDMSESPKLPLKIRGGVFAVRVIVAPSQLSRNIFERIRFSVKVTFIRFKERLRNFFSGKPRFKYSQITPRLYLGGTYRIHAYKQFKDWGITGIVNMRNSLPKPPLKGFEILHLKTRDWTPPSIADLCVV